MNIIEKNISKVIALCKQYKVKTLFVFGSVLTDKFHKDSDVDLLVDFNKNDIHGNCSAYEPPGGFTDRNYPKLSRNYPEMSYFSTRLANKRA